MLLTSLTYNTPIPQTLIDELNFNSNSLIVVRQHNGTIKTINGNIDKKTLYGYDSKQNILQAFNLANYSINNTGEVSLITKSFSNSIIPSNNVIPTKPTNTEKYISNDGLEIIFQDIQSNKATFRFNHIDFCFMLDEAEYDESKTFANGECDKKGTCSTVGTLTFSIKENTTYTLYYKLNKTEWNHYTFSYEPI
jgi:hypothetical protein